MVHQLMDPAWEREGVRMHRGIFSNWICLFPLPASSTEKPVLVSMSEGMPVWFAFWEVVSKKMVQTVLPASM